MSDRGTGTQRLAKNPLLYQGYLALSGEWKRRFQGYMAGKKTLPLIYDPFFKKLFSVDIHSERLSDFISSVLGEKVTVKCMLPNENRIVNEASLLIMDMLVAKNSIYISGAKDNLLPG